MEIKLRSPELKDILPRDGAPRRVLQSIKHSQNLVLPGLSLSLLILAASCAEQSTPVMPTIIAIPEQPKATATATSTPKVDFPALSPEQQAQAVERLKHVRELMREFVKQDLGGVAIDPAGLGDVAYARFWAKYNPDPSHTLTWVRTGPDGILGFNIVNDYSKTGRLLQSHLSANFIDSGNGDNIRQYIPQIGEYVQGQPGNRRIPANQLREVAEGIFNLPKMVWQETVSNYEAGTQVPTLKGSGYTADGSKLDFSIDSFGKVALAKTYPSSNLSFEQRLNPHKFTANGVLKPQYAPKKLGV